MKIPFWKLQEIDEFVGSLFAEYPDFKNKKFGYAYKRFAQKNYYPLYREYVEKLTAIRITNALTDSTGKILYSADENNERKFDYTPSSLLKVIEEERALEDFWQEKECDIAPWIIDLTDIPRELSTIEIEILKGVIVL